jgi:hypothetical protein
LPALFVKEWIGRHGWRGSGDGWDDFGHPQRCCRGCDGKGWDIGGHPQRWRGRGWSDKRTRGVGEELEEERGVEAVDGGEKSSGRAWSWADSVKALDESVEPGEGLRMACLNDGEVVGDGHGNGVGKRG